MYNHASVDQYGSIPNVQLASLGIQWEELKAKRKEEESKTMKVGEHS